jgi:hypothetical protein
MANFLVQKGMEHLVRHLRALPATIADLPRAWFQVIEPRIRRDPKRLAECWIWTGATTTRGEPKIDTFDRDKRSGNPRSSVFAKHTIANMFLDLHPLGDAGRRYEIIHLCPNKSCLNPSHMMLRFDQHKQRNVQELRDEHLSPGEYYQP